MMKRSLGWSGSAGIKVSQGATERSVIHPIQSVEGGTLRTRIGQNPMIIVDHGFLLEYVAAPHRFDEDITPV